MMFERYELEAMAWGYGVTIPIAVAAIYFGAPIIMAGVIFQIGFLITLVRLNSRY
jgi:hypothetical protein